eukprot:6455258-Amphidinium_carterae.1
MEGYAGVLIVRFLYADLYGDINNALGGPNIQQMSLVGGRPDPTNISEKVCLNRGILWGLLCWVQSIFVTLPVLHRGEHEKSIRKLPHALNVFPAAHFGDGCIQEFSFGCDKERTVETDLA